MDGILREWKRKQWLAAGCGLALFICLTLVQIVIIGRMMAYKGDLEVRGLSETAR